MQPQPYNHDILHSTSSRQLAPWVQACSCKKEDFHCEYGYEKKTNSDCKPMAVGNVPHCKAIKHDKYVASETHLRLGHGMTCPNLDQFIPDTNGNVRPPPTHPPHRRPAADNGTGFSDPDPTDLGADLRHRPTHTCIDTPRSPAQHRAGSSSPLRPVFPIHQV